MPVVSIDDALMREGSREGSHTSNNQSTMLSPNTFEGAAAGMDNLGLGADVEALHQDTVIGTKRPRFSNRSAKKA